MLPGWLPVLNARPVSLVLCCLVVLGQNLFHPSFRQNDDPSCAWSSCSASRRRFSSRPRRNMVGTAQSSPMVNGVTVWKAWMKRIKLDSSKAAIRVGNQFDGESVDARKAGKQAVCHLWELPVIAARQASPHLAQDTFHDMEVVEQPLGLGTQCLPPAIDIGNQMISLFENATVVEEAAEQRLACFNPGVACGDCKSLA